MRRAGYVALVAAALLPWGLAAAAPAHTEFIPDRRLDQTTSLSQPHGSLESYLERMSAGTAVPHEAKPPHGDRPLVIFNRGLTLRSLQKTLAGALVLSWARKGDLYPLDQSPRDRTLLRQAWEKREARALAQALARFRHKATLVDLSDAELDQRVAAGDEFAVLTKRDRRKGSMAKKLKLVASLPPFVLERVFAGDVVDVRYSNMSPEVQELFRSEALASGSNGIDQREMPAYGCLRIYLKGTWSRPELGAQFRYDRDSGSVSSLSSLSVVPDPGDRRGGIRWSAVPRHAAFKKKVSLIDTGRPKEGHFFGGERPPGALPLQPYLMQLSRQVDLPIVAECAYKEKDIEWLAKQWWIPATIKDEPLPRALDLLGADFEYEWQFREGAIVLKPAPGSGSGGKAFRPNVSMPPGPVPPGVRHARPSFLD